MLIESRYRELLLELIEFWEATSPGGGASWRTVRYLG